MGRAELQSFFDLGNSTRRHDKNTIGEKGHGTKVYFNARKLIVDTQREGTRFIAELDAPFSKLHDRNTRKARTDSEAHANNARRVAGSVRFSRDAFLHRRLTRHHVPGSHTRAIPGFLSSPEHHSRHTFRWYCNYQHHARVRGGANTRRGTSRKHLS